MTQDLLGMLPFGYVSIPVPENTRKMPYEMLGFGWRHATSKQASPRVAGGESATLLNDLDDGVSGSLFGHADRRHARTRT